jgi:hypothetical protein
VHRLWKQHRKAQARWTRARAARSVTSGAPPRFFIPSCVPEHSRGTSEIINGS